MRNQKTTVQKKQKLNKTNGREEDIRSEVSRIQGEKEKGAVRRVGGHSDKPPPESARATQGQFHAIQKRCRAQGNSIRPDREERHAKNNRNNARVGLRMGAA